jgi:hypothetical protein
MVRLVLPHTARLAADPSAQDTTIAGVSAIRYEYSLSAAWSPLTVSGPLEGTTYVLLAPGAVYGLTLVPGLATSASEQAGFARNSGSLGVAS